MEKVLLPLFAFFVFSMTINAQSISPSPYCNAGFDDQQGFPVDDHIDMVSFGSLSNTTNAQYAYPHYVFYNNLTAPNLTKGSTYTLKVRFTVAGGAGYGVWIDYNHNNAFENNELVSGTSGQVYLNMPNDSISVNVTIPSTAMAGNTRMRVRIVEDDNHHSTVGTAELACNADTSAINVMDWGETEDYTINIVSTASGIDEAQAISDVSIYPNPSHDLIKLNVTGNGNYAYSIMSASGQTIKDAVQLNAEQTIDVSSLANGFYLLKLIDLSTNTVRVLKFEKTRD